MRKNLSFTRVPERSGMSRFTKASWPNRAIAFFFQLSLDQNKTPKTGRSSNPHKKTG
jgi:hypothetical protein